MKAYSSYKVGKAAIVGRPNVGKSTLLNALVQHKVAIVSAKPQTTRSQIVAFLEDERGQIFFIDTPGFYAAKAGTSQYNSLIAQSIEEADVIVYLVDQTRDWGQEEERIWNQIEASEKPVLLTLNFCWEANFSNPADLPLEANSWAWALSVKLKPFRPGK